MNTIKTLAAMAIAAAAFTLDAQAGAFDATPKMYGHPAGASMAQRSIDITAGTRHINVTNGETITFNIGDKHFTWKFDLYHQEGIVELSFLLPGVDAAQGVKVHVAEDPVYREMYRN